MKKTVSAILFITLLISGCKGKSSDKDNQLISASTSMEKVVTITKSNQALSVSPGSKQSVLITGSNNDITISTEPSSVQVQGNDNTIRIKDKSKVKNSGAGNIILRLEGSKLFPQS